MNIQAVTQHPGAMFGVGLVVGVGATYWVANMHLKAKYAAIADEEVASVKSVYEAKREELVEEEEELLQKKYEESQFRKLTEDLEYREKDIPDTIHNQHVRREEVITVHSTQIIGGPDDDQDPENPYVIPLEEFMENDDYEKVSITYWYKDDTLADEREQIIPDVNRTVGGENLKMFGIGSQNEDTVYIRNVRIKTDFEVTRDERSFVEYTYGAQEEGEEGPRAIRKMRHDD